MLFQSFYDIIVHYEVIIKDKINEKRIIMGCLGNILWFIFGGFASGLSWVLAGMLWCITIIGIPIGRQCFKLAKLALMPFGATVK